MNGYIVTPDGATALAAFGLEGVRHAARLDTGEGFVAFDGPVPALEGHVWEIVEDVIPWARPQVRRTYIEPTTRDHFALLDSEQFRALLADAVIMASALTNDLILVVTDEPVASARWQATSIEWLDVRAKQAALA